jgi:hypothetical protein
MLGNSRICPSYPVAPQSRRASVVAWLQPRRRHPVPIDDAPRMVDSSSDIGVTPHFAHRPLNIIAPTSSPLLVQDDQVDQAVEQG